jgi:digeranylgeranylglycerophospholipid reductase
MSGETELFDVAVIGAGPMGSFAADRIARAGLKVVLFERDASPGDSTVCAGGLHHDLLRFVGLPQGIVEKTLPAFRVVINGRTSEWRFEVPTYVTVERRNLDVFLAERAVQAGVTLVTHARVVEVVPGQGTLWFELGPARSRERARARAFIFADGPNSLARRTLMRPHRAGRDPEYVAVEYDLEAPANSFDGLEIIPDPEALPFGYVWIFPKRDHVNVGLARLAAMDGPPLWSLLDRFVAARTDLRGRAVLARKGGVIPATVVPVLQRDNWLVIGDAAGMINPLTGGGYVCGFLSAAIAAETCIEAFRGGRFAEKVLRRYKRRLRLTRHYVLIRALDHTLSRLAALYRVFKKPLYLPFLRVYFHVVHITMRFVRVI